MKDLEADLVISKARIKELEARNKTMRRFHALRKRLFRDIEQALEDDGYCKPYEGIFEITTCYPSYFEEGNAPEHYVIVLHCYVIGPARHYEWRGKTLEAALDKCEAEINGWLEE